MTLIILAASMWKQSDFLHIENARVSHIIYWFCVRVCMVDWLHHLICQFYLKSGIKRCSFHIFFRFLFHIICCLSMCICHLIILLNWFYPTESHFVFCFECCYWSYFAASMWNYQELCREKYVLFHVFFKWLFILYVVLMYACVI